MQGSEGERERTVLFNGVTKF